MTVEEKSREDWKRKAAARAADWVHDGMTIGLGTGSTVFYLIEKVGAMVAAGANLRAVATSVRTEELARRNGIPLLSPGHPGNIDLAIDGVDEIDGNFNAVKGGGGALLREKIVAEWADEVIWILDEGKLVNRLGAFPLPVEILPFGFKRAMRYAESLGFAPALRCGEGGEPFFTDNGNYIMDLRCAGSTGYESVLQPLLAYPGVVEVGLFENMCARIVIGGPNGTEVRENPGVHKLFLKERSI